MKKILVLFSALFTILFLAACGDNSSDDIQDEGDVAIEESDVAESDNQEDLDEEESSDEEIEQDEEVLDQAENQEDMKAMMDTLNFDEIELEISYGNDKEYEIEMDHHSNGDVEAEIEDELNGEDIDDDLEAFNKLYPLVKKLDIEQGTEKDDVIKQVLDAFDLEDDYEEFEVDITFNDGTEIEYED